ncbi:14498_t:CDS:2, partial [Funneliformis geosporum]
MTQERINSNNNTYAFVLEDPSKPRKYQLNFHLDHRQFKEQTHTQPAMDQQTLSSHLPHNPQHHSLHHIDRNPLPSRQPPQITLPPITTQNYHTIFNSTSNDEPHFHVPQHSQQHSSHSLPQHTHQHHPSISEINSYHSSYPTQRYFVNHKMNQIPPQPHQINHQINQLAPQMSHHLPQQLPQQQVSQGYSQPPHNLSNMYNNNNDDHQPSVTVSHAPSYNSLRQYNPQVYSGKSVLPIMSSASSHVTPSHDPSSVRNAPLIDHSLRRDVTSSGPNVMDVNFMVICNNNTPPPPPSHLHVQHPQPQQQMYSQPPLLQVPPQNIPRSLTPPQLHLPPQQPQPNHYSHNSHNSQQYLSENRETSPFHLAPPSHHHSGSNSSVSTRSSSPAPSTPIASTTNMSFPPNGGAPVNNNPVPHNVEKPAIEQNLPVKKKGRSKQPRPIVPAGPIPIQQPAPSTQSLPSSSSSETPVFVQYVVPNIANDSNPQNNHIIASTKPPQTSRSRKNSISGGSASSASKRGRKAKDSSKVSEEVHNYSPVLMPVKYVAPQLNQGRKREYSPLPSSTDNLDDDNINKRCKKDERVFPADDIVMEDVTRHDEKDKEESQSNSMDIDVDEISQREEAVSLLLSLTNPSNPDNSYNIEPTVNNAVTPAVEPDAIINNEIRIKEEPMVEEDIAPVDNNAINDNVEVENLKKEKDDQLVTTGVKEMSLHEDDFLSLSSIKEEVEEEKEKPSYVQEKKAASKTKKKQNVVKLEKNISNTRVAPKKVNDKKEIIKNLPVGNDSDSDLAMDDGSEGEDEKNKPPERKNYLWNSDDMETEEEVEEEIEISVPSNISGITNVTKDGDNKQTVGYYSSPPSTLTPNVSNHQKDIEDVKKEINSTANNTNVPINKSRPNSPTTNNGIFSRKASTSSSVSRKGSISSNGSNKEKDNMICSSPTEMTSSSVKTIAAESASSSSNGTRPQRPCPPRRRSTMRDDEKLELDNIEWEKNIEIPRNIWEETLRVFEIVKQSKEMKNRQPHRKRNHILASILFILCRQNGLPRTFVEICNAASIRKQEIGTYYRLMLKVFESNGLGGGTNGTSLRTVDSAEYLKRWCQNLKLPTHILDAAIHVYKQASELNITTGKCPVSVGAASIWLSINTWNDARSKAYNNIPDDAELIKVEHKDVAAAAGVVNATLVGCYKNLLKYKDQLLPERFLTEAGSRSPHSSLKSELLEKHTNLESDANTPLSLDSVKYYDSPTTDCFDIGKSTAELKVEPTSKPVAPALQKLRIKPQVKSEKNETNTQALKSQIKEVTSVKVEAVSAFIKKEVEHEPVLQSPPRVANSIPKYEP